MRWRSLSRCLSRTMLRLRFDGPEMTGTIADWRRRLRKALASYPLSPSRYRAPFNPFGNNGGTGLSAALPPVGRKANGRPITSERAWISVVWPPCEAPIAWHLAPFTAMGGSVRLDVGSIDGGAFGHGTRGCQGLDQINPEPASRPTVVAIVDRGRGAVFPRRSAPPAAGLQDMDDPGHHCAIVNPPGAGLVPGPIRLNRRPLRVCQPEQT